MKRETVQLLTEKIYWHAFAHECGSVAERSKALVLGTSLYEAWVRIPPLPVNDMFLLRMDNVSLSKHSSAN
ncbi:hypothetical protein HNY73_018093 [Argiope bruennichi]|uniref:Uncharacterized protein n=1 Tax=Argiope bruennichi TaxID=94029 RepID=A0A8T0EFU9_ARGBR|nr:hypothetical protein HNY73_018093 [Argiope bruennichi]